MEKKQLCATNMDVRWGDMDALGHVNNAAYFRYMEEARIRWLTDIKRPITGLEKQGPVLINASCVFLKPVAYPAKLRLVLLTEPPGNSSFNLLYEFYLDRATECVAQGQSKVVWTDYQKAKSMTLPDELRALLL